jgi:beta-lactamase regulating signal transducer with metallopeptidase domain
MQNLMILLLTCSVTTSALALLYMASTPFLAKRYSEKGRYYTWLIIVIGLIIPFRPSWDNPIIRVDIPSETVAPIFQSGNVIQAGSGTQMGNEALADTPAVIENAAPYLAPHNISWVWTWWQIVTFVWFAGAIIFLAYHIIKHYHFVKTARRWSENVTDEQALALFQYLKDEMGITKRIELCVCSCVSSPMIIGFVNPIIFLPTDKLVRDELRYILKHELVHHKRKDLLYKYLVLAATTIHWFNPVVYLMAKTIANICEASCDAEVVRGTDVDTRQSYSEIIIGVAKYQSKLKTVLSTNFYGGKKGMKNRISSIMDTRKKKMGLAIMCMALIVTLGTGIVFAANAREAEHNYDAVTRQYNNTFNAVATKDAESYNGANGQLGDITPEQYASIFDLYKEYGLTYDKTSNSLYYKGELVRYFEDKFLVPTDGSTGDTVAGTDHYNKDGTVDVRAVRDLSQIVRNPDGSTNPGGKLIGLEPLSQAEFDSRIVNIEKPMNQAQAGAYMPDSYNGDTMSYNTANTNPMTSDEMANEYSIYEPFGVTYDKNTNNLYYNGKLVKNLLDILSTNNESLTGGNFYGDVKITGNPNGEISMITVRDYNDLDKNGHGKLVGIEVVG